MTSDSAPLDALLAVHAGLDALGIPHALIGGWAVISWGMIRATNDIDWLADIPLEKKKPAVRRMEGLGYAAEWRIGDLDDPVGALLRLTPSSPNLPVVDILLARRGYDRQALQRSQNIRLGTADIPVVRPEYLIAMKLSAGGGQDIEDARGILRVQDKTLDMDLLRRACAGLKVASLLGRIRKSL